MKGAALALSLGLATVVLSACGDSAHSQTVTPPGATTQANQTLGFANGMPTLFTYTQSYDCVDEPNLDLDFNTVMAQSDPAEFQTPICQAATQSSIDPTGASSANTAVLYVLVPMFSVDSDTNPADAIACDPKAGFRSGTLCGTALGQTLVKLFGAIPEAFKEKPSVYTDCPNPGSPAGTCTMHASTVDLGKVLVALGKLPAPATNVFLPTPNHSHVIDGSLAVTKPIWWEVKPVLILNQADWPTQDGSSGITSVAMLQAAEAAGNRAIEVPSNFYLFFGSQMAGMSMGTN
ncbi:MAG: hypothetical protein EPN72_13285 [Nevskiaceae bacterium]|nr:MAG: hypothetical protein EPN72_13285 [Nevskiaceae bacterium]